MLLAFARRAARMSVAFVDDNDAGWSVFFNYEDKSIQFCFDLSKAIQIITCLSVPIRYGREQGVHLFLFQGV